MSTRLPSAFLIGLTASALAGCAAEEDQPPKPPKPPTAAALARFVADTRQPAYWLGPRFRDVAVSHVGVGRFAIVTYGEWSCDPGSGCTDSGSVATGPHEASLADVVVADGADPRDCWSRIGKAVAVLEGCIPDGYPQLLTIYSGALAINVTSIYTRDGQGEVSARTALRRLRPVNSRAPWPLPAPRPLTCRQFREVDPRLRSHMPRPLRPTCRS